MAALARARNLRAVTEIAPRVVIYVRQSTQREESISLELQETACRDYCAQRGYTVVRVISDPGITGRTWVRRKGVQDAMGSIESGEAEIIVLWRWSRLSRRRLHWAIATDKVDTLGGRIESATEPVDTATAAGRFSRGVLAEVAAFESERIGEGWVEAHDARRARGLPATGGRRFGYAHVRESGAEERYEIDPDEAEVITWMYQRYLDGAGMPAIARGLNQKGIVTVNGRPWQDKAVRDLLDAGFSAGLIHRVPVREGIKIIVPFPDRVWDQGAHTSIISTETWDAYRVARIARRTVPARTLGPAHNLSGLVRCGEPGCDFVMWRKTTQPRGPENRMYAQFICSRKARTGIGRMVSISERRLTALVLDWLQREAAADVTEEALRDDAMQTAVIRSRADIEIMNRDLIALDRQITNLTRQLAAELMPESVYRTTLAELLAERTEIDKRNAIAKEAARDKPARPVALARGLLANWETLSVARRRDLLGKIIRQIVVSPPERKHQRAQVEIIPTWAK